MPVFDKAGIAGTVAGAGAGMAMGAVVPYAGAGLLAAKGIQAAVKGRKKAFKPIKEAKDLLKADVEAMKQGKLGLTDSEIQRQVAIAQQAAGSQAQAGQTALARQALGGQGFQQGAFTEASRGIQDEAQTAGVAASAQAYEASRAIQEREASRIRGALEDQRERAKEAAMATRDRALGLVGGLLSAAGDMTGITGLSVAGTAISGQAPTVGKDGAEDGSVSESEAFVRPLPT